MASTLHLISKRAGVSVATVTRVLNGNADYRRGFYATRAAQIRAIAAELDYRPSVAAQAMGSGRFNTICLVSGREPGVGHLPPQLVDGVCEAASEAGLLALVARLDRSSFRTTTSLPPALARRAVDGLLINWTHRLPPEVEERLEELNLPLVWLNTDRSHDGVRFADDTAAIMAVQRLVELGHRRIAWYQPGYHDAQTDAHYSSPMRVNAYRQAMQEAGLTPEIWNDPLGENNQLENTRASYMVEALAERFRNKRRATAVICPIWSELVVQGAERAGIQVPTQLAVIAISRMRDRTHAMPIAHLRLPDAALGARGVQRLIQRIKGGAPQPTEALPLDIIEEHYLLPPTKG